MNKPVSFIDEAFDSLDSVIATLQRRFSASSLLMKKHADKVVIETSVVGFTKDEVSVEIDDKTLTVRANANREENRFDFFANEAKLCTVDLPRGAQVEKASAIQVDGVLRVVVPLDPEKSRPVVIEVS